MSSAVHRRFKLRPISAALLAALATPAAFAADETESPVAPASTTTEATLPEVEVHGQSQSNDYNAGVTSTGGKTPTAIRDVPQSVTVINRSVMDAQGVTTLKDALRNVPGITLSSGEGGNIGDNVNIRGYSARTDLFLDGFRDRGHYSRETFFLESVEVLKGPSSMLFGRGSTGGVINQVTKQANLDSRREISSSVGTDAYSRITADVDQAMSATSAFRIAGLSHSEESTRDVVEVERHGIAPSLRFGIGTPTAVTVSALHQSSQEVPDYGLPFTAGTVDNPAKPVDVDMDNFFGFTNDFFNQSVSALSARVEHKFSPTLSLRNQIQLSESNTHAAPTVYPSTPVPPAGQTNRDRRERKQEDKSIFNQTDLIVKFDTGGIRHTLVSGVEIGRDEYRRQSYTWANEPTQNLDDPVYGPLNPGGAVTRTKDATRSENESKTLAIYVNDTLELSQQWKFIGGLRWDRFEADADTITNSTGATTTVARTDRMVSMRAGVLYQPDDRQSYYVSYGTSFNPSAEALTLSVANAELEPEENRSTEVGGKWDLLNGKLALAAALFHVQKTNARTTDPLTSVVTLDGDTEVKGFELSASGQLAPNWQVFAGYTQLDGKVVESKNVSGGVPEEGKVLANTPEQSASLWTVYGFARNWEIGGGMVYSADRFLNNANTSMIDGYTRLDATIGFTQPSYSLRLNLLNLNDEEYFEASSASRATPAKGRSAVLTLNFRL